MFPNQVVIASSGVGHVLRGYEIFATNLFSEVKSTCHVKLYKGAGKSGKSERVLPTIRRAWTRKVLGDRRAENLEQVTFAIGLLTQVGLKDESCIIHISEPWSARILCVAKSKFNFKYTILFTNGGGARPAFMKSFDFIHHNSFEAYKAALEHGIPDSKMFFIPNAIHFARFLNRPEKTALRKKYAIPEQAFVILAVSALNAGEKRLDYLIEEVSRIESRSVFLLVAGNRGAETIYLKRLAEEKLKARYKFLTVRYERMPEIYGVADAFVHSAISEGAYPPFAVLEAMASKLPVLVHRNDGFRRVISDADSLVDMKALGQLSERIIRLMKSPQVAKQRADILYRSAFERFDWSCLRDKYLNMYQVIAMSVRKESLSADSNSHS